MDTPEEDVKPTILLNDVVKLQTGIKSKHSRYEDVWPADVHAAFMEAIALYPPMGKRRVKYYRVSAGADETDPSSDSTRIKSFGRCQLIQAYILEKTGKNRTRKQVSSHLQRLKKIHKDNPAMRAFFSETSQALLDNYMVARTNTRPTISQDLSPSSSPPKSEPAIPSTGNFQNTITSLDRPSTFSYHSDFSSSVNGMPRKLESSANPHCHPSFMFSQENFSLQGCQTGAPQFQAFDDNPLFEYHDPPKSKDSIGGAVQASMHFNESTFSMSGRRLFSRRPSVGRPLDLPTSDQSRTAYSHGFQPAHQINSRDGIIHPSLDSPYYFPASPNGQFLGNSLHSVQALHPDERLLSQHNWAWPQDSDVSFSPFVAPLSRRNAFSDIRLQYPVSMYQFSSLCLLAEKRLGSPGSYTSSSESDGSMLSTGLSIPTLPSPISLFETMPTRAPIAFSDVDVPASSEYLATPLVIKPTPLYPLSYVHSDDHTGLLSEYQTAAFNDHLPAQTLYPSSEQ